VPVTWHSPNAKDPNQIDNILFPKRYASVINTAKTRSSPGADVGNDHELIMVSIHITLFKQKRKKNSESSTN